MGNCASSGQSKGHSKSNNKRQSFQPPGNERRTSKAVPSSSSPHNSQFNALPNNGYRKNTSGVSLNHKGISEEPPKIVGERLKPNVGRDINRTKPSTSSQQSLSTQSQKNNDSVNNIKYKAGNHNFAEVPHHSVDEHKSNKTQRIQPKTQQNLSAQLSNNTQPPKDEFQLPTDKPLQATVQNSKHLQYVSTKNGHGTYPPPDEETMKFIENEFQKGFDFSLKKHKEMMNKLVETKEPFTEAQLTQYHHKNLQVTVKAYEEAYRPACVQQHEEVKSLFETKIKELGSSIKKQLMVYQRKHEITIEKVTKMVRDSSNDAEEHYDDLMSGFDFNSKTKKEFLECHEKYRKEAFSFFDNLLAKKGLRAAAFWRHELNHKLDESCKEHILKFSSQNGKSLKNYETSRPNDTVSAVPSSVQRLPSFTELNANSTSTSAATKFFSEQHTAGTHLKHGSSRFDESVTVTNMSRSTTTTSSISTNESLTSQALNSSFKRRRFSKGTNNTALDISGEEEEKVTENGNTHSYKQIGVSDPTSMSFPDSSKSTGTLSLPDVINIGVYMDEISIIVGTFLPNPQERTPVFDPFVEVHPEVVFIDDAVIIGSEAAIYKGNPNHFKFYSLVVHAKDQDRIQGQAQQQSSMLMSSSRSRVHVIYLKGTRLLLTTEDIMAAFLWTLLKKLEEMKSARINQIIFTIPFGLTNVEKQRLRSSVRLAGFKKDIRVLSTSLATTISHAYKITVKPNKTQAQFLSVFNSIFLVLHYQKHSFSIAIVQSDMNKIEVKKIITSDSYYEGQNPTFHKNHGHMSGGGKLSPEGSAYIFNVYKKAIHDIFGQIKYHYQNPMPTIDSFIIVRRAPTKLDKMIRNAIILNTSIPIHLKIVERSLIRGPVLGSAALASDLPDHVKYTQDISPLKLKLFMNDVEQEYVEEPFRTRNSAVVSEAIGLILFRFKFTVADTGTLRIKVLEEITTDTSTQQFLNIEACRYDLKIRCDQPRKEYLLTLICSVDQDGMYNLSVTNPCAREVDLQVLKVTNSNVPTYNDSTGFDEIIRFYTKSK